MKSPISAVIETLSPYFLDWVACDYAMPFLSWKDSVFSAYFSPAGATPFSIQGSAFFNIFGAIGFLLGTNSNAVFDIVVALFLSLFWHYESVAEWITHVNNIWNRRDYQVPDLGKVMVRY